MSKYAENAPREIRAYIEANYGKLSPEALLQELFAHRFAAEQSAGLRAAALKNENASWLAKVAGAAKRLWRSFVAALGGNRIDAKTLSALSPDEAMRRLAEGMAHGQTLGRAPNGRGLSMDAEMTPEPTAAERAEAQRQYDEVVARYTNADGTRKTGLDEGPERQADETHRAAVGAGQHAEFQGKLLRIL